MNDRSGSTRPEGGPSAKSGGGSLARFAAQLALGLPRFDGPLVAFDPVSEGASVDPVCLGGDLHRIHPDASEQYPRRRRDKSLDGASISLIDQEHGDLEVRAVEGLWCVATDSDLLDSATTFTLWDTEGRLRIWLFLPPVRKMIGIGHLWLPSVPPLLVPSPVARHDHGSSAERSDG